MTSLPASQTWLYVRNNSSFLVKRKGGDMKRAGAQFSREPGNLTQTNTFHASGLCNEKAIDINLDEDGKIVMSKKAPKNGNKPAKAVNKTPLRKNFRRAAKAITTQTAGKFYRGDLTGKALARFAALHRFNKVKEGLAKKAKTKTGRREAAAGGDDEGMPSLTN
jgi:large subunit ribosomal protein L28e